MFLSLLTPPIIPPSGPTHSADITAHRFLVRGQRCFNQELKCSNLYLPLDATLFVPFLCFFSMSFFISSRNLFGSIPNSQTDPPTFHNVDFLIRISSFLRNQRFRSKHGFAIVLGLSRAPLGSSWGALGSSEGLLNRPKRASRFMLELSWAWFARLLLPKMALGGFWGRR